MKIGSCLNTFSNKKQSMKVLKSRKGAFSILALAFITIIIIAVGGFSLGFSATNFFHKLGIASLAGYDMVYKQNWGHMCCEQESTYDIKERRLLSQKTQFKCEAYTDECQVQIDNIRDPGFFTNINTKTNYQICSMDWASCTPSAELILQSGQNKILTVPAGHLINFAPDSVLRTNYEYTQVTIQAKSFYLQGQENGKVYREDSCKLTDDLASLTEISAPFELSRTGSNRCINYLLDFILVATQTYTYGGEEVICQAKQVYHIDKRQFKDGLYSDVPVTVKFQGDAFATVQCCPSEPNCDPETFKYTEQPIEKECTYSSECFNGGDPIAIDSTHYKTFSCINNKCVESEAKQVQCTTNQQCVTLFGMGYICDQSTHNYGTCRDAPKGPYCGDGTCQTLNNENDETCSADCVLPPGAQLPWYFWAVLIALFILAYRPIIKPTLAKLGIGKYFP